MPVDTKHSEYEARISQWARCRDCIDGTDTIKAKRTKYLPMLGGQTSDEYDAYIDRALFYGATSRTVLGLKGAIFRKDFVVNYPEIYKEHIDVLTPNGFDLDEFARQSATEILTTGRIGILVDANRDDDDIRAYAAIYSAENIINWRTTLIGGKQTLSMVVLREKYSKPKADDIFSVEEKTQYRVLSLVPTDTGGYVYQQDVYKQTSDEKVNTFVIDPELTVNPQRMGMVMDFIPFIFINVNNHQPTPEKPPLLDMVDVNLSHYKSSADLEHGAHYTALPTAWVAGFPKDSELRIGSGVAWVTEEVNAKADFLEYTGQGLNALEKRLEAKEDMMARLGARMLETQKRSVESAETHKIRQSGETGVLTTIVRTLSDGIERALKWIAWWSGASDQQLADVKFELNTDFIDTTMQPKEIETLMKAWQSGAISQDTFLYNLKRGEILPDGTTIDDEKLLIEKDSDAAFDDANVTPIKSKFNVVRGPDGRVAAIEGDI